MSDTLGAWADKLNECSRVKDGISFSQLYQLMNPSNQK